jgi:hypothetical protein
LTIEKSENLAEIQKLRKISGVKDNPKKGAVNQSGMPPSSARPSSRK